uniref:Uncharacterized protein n=1 Tax=Rhizophora mucronata TaxID=61149 RepID=A0A2P2QT41_RHIMU
MISRFKDGMHLEKGESRTFCLIYTILPLPMPLDKLSVFLLFYVHATYHSFFVFCIYILYILSM